MTLQALRVADTRNLDRDKWLQVRRRGIGGSEIAAIAGVNPWESALSIYLRKRGEIPEPEENEAMRWGRIMEPVVAEEYKARHPEHRVERVNAVLQHPDESVFLANIDRRILGDPRGPGVLEIKTSSAWQAGKWRDDCPDHVTCQTQWYMGVTGYSWAVVAALIGGNRYEEFPIDRDEEIIDYLFRIAKQFWTEHIEPGIPPAVDGSQATTDALGSLYGEPSEKPIDLPPQARRLIEEREAAKVDEQIAKERRREAENGLKGLLGNHTTGTIGAHTVRWSRGVQRRLDTKALRSDLPDIYDQYRREIPTERFTVKEVS